MTEIGHIITYAALFTALFFEVFLLVSFLERRFGKTVHTPKSAKELALPRVSIVVPCFNEENTVAGTLDSLLSLSYPHGKLEILVIDDGSTDRTAEIAHKYALDSRVRIYRKKNGGKHTAMNLALAKTDAELIGCLDADSVVEASSLAMLARPFENKNVAAITPGIHVREPKTFLQHMQNVEYLLSVFNRFMFSALGSAFITPGPFSIFRTSVVRELGGWRHGHSTEDMEMALRIQAAGYLIGNAPSASVHTTTPHTLKALFRQRVRWAYGFLRNAIDYRSMFINRMYGNLGMIILPAALISIAVALFFFARIFWYGAHTVAQTYARAQIIGISFTPSFDLFYINTSAILFLIYVSILLIVVLISVGSLISTGRRLPPSSTPLFIIFYGFLVPLWLATAVVRAFFGTGVRWK